MIKKNFLFTAFVIFIGYTSIANAQTSFVQSRYLDAPISSACSSCDLGDGIVHIRFKPGSAQVSGDKVEFTAQMRKTGEASRGITSAVFRLAFDEEVFGAQLNTPAIANGNTPADGGQCTFTRSDLFTSGTRSYSIFFGDSASNQLAITEQSSFAVISQAAIARPASFAFLSNEWQDMVTLSCTIPSGKEASDAGLAVHGSEPLGTTIAEFPDTAFAETPSGDRVDRPAILVVDNDMRGLRLDGKTWAEDYVRYGDGKGVRLKFSKGIKTQLTVDSFDLTADGASTTITSVSHTAGEAYANVEFLDAIADGTLRLSDASIVDVDDVALASGNFLAALNYDEAAPQVTAAAKDSTAIVGGNNHSTWSIDFSSALSADTVNASGICVTESNGLCVETPSVPVVSVSVSNNGEEMELVINEGDGQVGGMRSIEFRRNAVLGADFKVAEDYQVLLRNAIEIEDTKSPTISITAATADADSVNTLQYTINFTVTANEPVPSLVTPASYQLLRLQKNGSESMETGTPTVTGNDREVNIEYTYTFSGSGDKSADDVLGETVGFTLGRGLGTSLQDTAATPKDPIDIYGGAIANGGRLDPQGGVADTQPPEISITNATAVADSVNPLQYTISFTVEANESVPTLNTTASYQLSRISKDGTETVVGTVSSTISGDDREVDIVYTFIFTDDTVLGDTIGFTLVRAGTSLQDTASRDPVATNGETIAPGGRLDPDADGAAADIKAPEIRVTSAMAEADENNPLQYTITFTVTADEPVPTLATASSYLLWRLPRDGGFSVETASSSITGNNREVTIEYTYTFTDTDATIAADVLRNTIGFTLARAGTSLQDTSDRNPLNRNGVVVGPGERLDPSEESVAITDQPLSCAAFYPYINQTEIFLRVKSDTLNMGGFAYTDAGGVRVMATEVERVSSIPADDIYIVKIIREEIGYVDSIEVSYTLNDGTEESATCEASISEDTDEDGIVDIVDSNPFNETVTGVNPQTGGVLATAPTRLDAFYSRSVLIRNLVRGDLTAMEYFGIGTPEAKAFNKNRNSRCQLILDAAVSSTLNAEGTVHLTGVNIEEYCGREVTNMFGDEPAGVQHYAWVEVKNGRLSSRPFHVDDVNVIPEINFAGQSSYLLAIPTESQTVTISAYVKGTAVANNPVDIEVVTSSDVAGIGSDPVDVTLAVDNGLIASPYTIGNGLIRAGHSATYQLRNGGDATIYSAMATTRTKVGGHDADFLANITHAIGPNNTITAKVVEHEKEIEQIIEVHNILLYDITGFNGQPNSLVQANRLVSGREYVLVADYTPTTTHDITRFDEGDLMVTDPIDYVEKPEDENIVQFPVGHRHRNGTHYASIEFTVADDITDTRAIKVGWNNIGSVKPVVATYLAVRAGVDAIIVDEDLDGIPDVYDDVSDRQALQSFAASNTGTMGNVLRVTRDMQEAFMSDVGRNMAILIDGSTATWTAANISHDGVSASIQSLGLKPEDVALIFLNDPTPSTYTNSTGEVITREAQIEKLATFGVRDIEPAVDNDQMVGGVAYVTFPMQSEVDTVYIGKYNASDDTWYRFERGGIEIDGENYDDTWYAIDRGAADADCPTDIEVYKNEHRAAGENGLGFNKGTDGWNCIMAVLTDGGPYDSDGSVNGRVIDPIATVTNLLSEQEFVSGGDDDDDSSGGGGGGAIGIFDMLLLITALLLLMVAGTQRRKLSLK